MPPTRIADDVVTEVKTIWAGNPEQSALAVWREYEHRKGYRKLISKRKVQQIVAEAKKEAGPNPVPFPLAEWHPWVNEAESADDNDHLLRMDAACVLAYQRHLYEHEAKWGRKLRVALTELSRRGQLTIIREYASREEVAFYLKVDTLSTTDLDVLLAYKPWLSGNRAVYYYAVTAGTIPPLLGPILSELDEGPEKSASIKYLATLQALAAHGHVPGLPYLPSLDFNMPPKTYEPVMSDLGIETMIPSAKFYDPAEADFETPEAFLEWLRLTVSEFWAGRPPTPGIPESEGGNDEREH